MIGAKCALRRLTVCQLTYESRGNGGGLRPRVWLRLRAAAGGNWTPDGILQLGGEANFSLFMGHMKRTQNYFVWGCFPKIEWAPAYVGAATAAWVDSGDVVADQIGSQLRQTIIVCPSAQPCQNLRLYPYSLKRRTLLARPILTPTCVSRGSCVSATPKR